MSEKLLVPDIGEFEKVEIIELLVKAGDQISLNDPVVTIESDKSSVEIPSSISGKGESINIKVGDKVSKGDLLLSIESSKKSSSEKPIPKDTESIIKQAESVLKKTKKKIDQQVPVEEKKQNIIQVANNNDIDPLETQAWVEPLWGIVGKDGDQRADALVKELSNEAYRGGARVPDPQHAP